MKLPHRWKRLKRVLLLFFVFCFGFELVAQSKGKRILLIPKAGKGASIEDAKSISKDIKIGLVNKGYIFRAEPEVLANLAAEKQKLGVDADQLIQDIGKNYESDLIMPCTLDKLSAQSYKISCLMYHKIKDEKNADYWESWQGSGYIEYGSTVDDLSKKITQYESKEKNLFKRIEDEKNISSSSCRNVNGGFFTRRLEFCSTNSFQNKFVECFDNITDQFCSSTNRTTSCIDSCRANATTLLVYIFISILYEQLQAEVIKCQEKGNWYSYNVEKKSCEYANPNEAAEKEANAKKECQAKGSDYFWSAASCKLTIEAIAKKKAECERNEGTWNVDTCKYPIRESYPALSFIVPGAGLISKRRAYLGILLFAVTTGAAADYYNKLQSYHKAKEGYQSIVPIPYPINMGWLGNYLYYDYRYREYDKAANTVTDAANVFLFIYLFQVYYSYTAETHSNFLSSLKQADTNVLGYNLQAKRESSVGIPNSFGTVYTFTLTWRF